MAPSPFISSRVKTPRMKRSWKRPSAAVGGSTVIAQSVVTAAAPAATAEACCGRAVSVTEARGFGAPWKPPSFVTAFLNEAEVA